MSSRSIMNDVEEASGRATRARTRLIVEGFTNLALVAILFSGVQAQFISVTNNDQENALSVATNAVFFGGLVFSVFTAVLATLSGRWFSILREDDSDYLSSRWLAQDCLETESRKEELKKYLEYQIEVLIRRIRAQEGRPSITCPTFQAGDNATNQNAVGSPSDGISSALPEFSQRANNSEGQTQNERYDPILIDLKRTLKLLNAERTDKLPDLVVKDLEPNDLSRQLQPHESTSREWIFRWILLSPLAVCIIAFALFCAGILMLAWNKQQRPVAIFTSATVLVCVILLVGFSLRHRHKHVIKKLVLSRFSL